MSLCGELIISKCEIPPVVHYQKVCAWYNILSNGCSPKLVGKYPKKTRKNSMPLLEVHRYLEGGDIDVVLIVTKNDGGPDFFPRLLEGTFRLFRV